ncbi:MAG: Uma2 family endonuclease, partial [Dolichospermum sp.]
LQLAGKLPETALVTTNYGICTAVNDDIVVKAPDWAYIPKITVSREEVQRSYTPHKQGELPVVVMEFLSDTEGGELSLRSTPPYGKLYFYEHILQVPTYVTYDPYEPSLEVRCLQ